MAASSELLTIDPLELKFPFELNRQISCPLRLTNKTDNYVAFKVKTTSPKKYCVRPNNGVVLPRSTCEVVVTMQAQAEEPLEMQCKDKFLVQSVVVGEGLSAKDITPQMFSKEEGNVVEEVKLKVAYLPPPERERPSEAVAPGEPEEIVAPKLEVVDNESLTPSELSSGSESLRSMDPVQEVPSRAEARDLKSMEILKNSDPTVETRAYAGHTDEQSLDSSALISRLTEEKNSAIQQNRKLRDELDLVRREVSKQHGGFSLMFVVAVALLGIILGYFVKK